MKLATMRDHLERIHSVKNEKDLEYFKMLRQKLRAQLNYDALKVFVKSINTIKAYRLNFRLFAKLCEEHGETFSQLLLHTEVRWLSRGDSLQRLVDLHDSSDELQMKVDPLLYGELKQC